MTEPQHRFIGEFNGINEAAQEALWHIDSIMEDRGWDHPPVLLGMYMHQGTGAAKAIEVRSMPAWHLAVAFLEDPIYMLEFWNKSLASFGKERVVLAFQTESLYAMAMVCEAWITEASYSDPDLGTMLAQAQAHKLDKNPKKIEARLICSVNKDKEVTMFVHKRNGVAQILGEGHEFVDKRIEINLQLMVELMCP